MKPQPEGAMCLFTLKNPSFPEYVCITETGVMCVDIHPVHPFLVCIGKYDGNVAVYNVQSPEKVPQYESNSVTNKHCGTVWQVILKQISVFSLCPFCFLLPTLNLIENTWPYFDIYFKIIPEYAVKMNDRIVLEFMDKVQILIQKTEFFFSHYMSINILLHIRIISQCLFWATLFQFTSWFCKILFNNPFNYLYIHKYASSLNFSEQNCVYILSCALHTYYVSSPSFHLNKTEC